jgi:PhoPQ-activated pathogenicity-related protein
MKFNIQPLAFSIKLQVAMKKLTLILLLHFAFCISHAQNYATKEFVNHAIDSLSHTLDSTVDKYTKVTASNETITVDTLTTEKNTMVTFRVLLQTNVDIAEKLIEISNTNGLYTIVADKNTASLSTKMFSTLPRWAVSIKNNHVIIEVTGVRNKSITWKISKTIAP